MALNFTGRAPPEPPPAPRRAPVLVLACFGVAALLAGLVFVAALRQHRVEAATPLPPLTGGDLAAAAPAKPAPAPAAEPAWILHKAAPAPVATPAAQPAGAASAPKAQDPAAAKARMLAALRQVPHGTITLQVEDDPMAKAYGDRLASLFREAGWTVDMSSIFGSGPPRRGMAAAFGISPSDEAVREAFDAVGFQFQRPPADAGVTRTPEIFVGTP